MERDVFNDGVIVYRNLFTKIIKCNDQSNVRNGYTRYKVLNDNNIIMVFACEVYTSFCRGTQKVPFLIPFLTTFY